MVTGGGLPLIREWEALAAALGEKQALLAAVRGTPYAVSFAAAAAAHESTLAKLERVLTRLQSVQRKWVSLEPLFGSPPHRSMGGGSAAEGGSEQLRRAEAYFRRADRPFRDIMRRVGRDPRVLSLLHAGGGSDDGRLEGGLNEMLRELESCQRALAHFLETCRLAFPRFCFLGDDDVLELVGGTKKTFSLLALPKSRKCRTPHFCHMSKMYFKRRWRHP